MSKKKEKSDSRANKYIDQRNNVRFLDHSKVSVFWFKVG